MIEDMRKSDEILYDSLCVRHENQKNLNKQLAILEKEQNDNEIQEKLMNEKVIELEKELMDENQKVVNLERELLEEREEKAEQTETIKSLEKSD